MVLVVMPCQDFIPTACMVGHERCCMCFSVAGSDGPDHLLTISEWEEDEEDEISRWMTSSGGSMCDVITTRVISRVSCSGTGHYVIEEER